jgi:hypothetical protein
MDIKELEAKVKELEAKVTKVNDIEEILALQNMYGYYLDNRLHEDVAALFSDNAESVEIANRGVYLGKEGINRFFLHAQGKPAPRFWMARHLQLQGVVHVDDDGKTAKGRFQCFMILATESVVPGIPRPCWGYGVYENEYVKENGKWMFKKVHFNRIFYTPYEDGWVKTPDISSVPRDPVKPDLPPTAYHPYPNAQLLPFHYKNPITGK